MYFIGLDVGTSNIKAVAFNNKGDIISKHVRSYQLKRDEIGHVELDPVLLWSAAKVVLGKVILDCGKDNIKTISVSAFGEAFVAINKSGIPISNMILATDIRGVQEVNDIKRQVSVDYLIKTTGLTPSSTYSIPKMCSLKKNGVYQDVWKYLLVEDYLNFKLTGHTVTDYSVASRTMGFDINKQVWDENILSASGIAKSKLSDVVCSGTIIGYVSEKAAISIGLGKYTNVVVGGHDQPCGAFGAGCIKPGDMANSCGTTECITPILTGSNQLKDITVYNMPCEPGVLNNSFISMAYNHTAGNLLEWFVKNIFYHGMGGDKSKAFELLESKISGVETDIMVLPHFAGAATPHMDEKSKGAFLKMNLSSKIEEIYLAIIESLVFEMKVNIENLKSAGIDGKQLYVFGGGANSNLWLKLKASILDKELRLLAGKEAGALGVVMLSAIATGEYGSADEAIENMVSYEKTIQPDRYIQEKYKEKYSKYKSLYYELKQTNHN